MHHDARMNAISPLSNADAAVNLAVTDVARARDFYGGVLGLSETGRQGEQLVSYRSGSSLLFVYKSEYAGTNKATAATWVVGEDVEGVVQELKTKGVAFEKYDFPDTTRKGDVHIHGSNKAAWFKDPDGNILAIVNG